MRKTEKNHRAVVSQDWKKSPLKWINVSQLVAASSYLRWHEANITRVVRLQVIQHVWRQLSNMTMYLLCQGVLWIPWLRYVIREGFPTCLIWRVVETATVVLLHEWYDCSVFAANGLRLSTIFHNSTKIKEYLLLNSKASPILLDAQFDMVIDPTQVRYISHSVNGRKSDANDITLVQLKCTNQ